MVKRRSLDDALTPEEETFIQTGRTTTPKAKAEVSTPPSSKTDRKRTAAPASAEPPAEATQAANVKPELVDLHTRVEAWINAALLRASTERKIQRVPPYTQRDIVAEALAKWLEANGYLR